MPGARRKAGILFAARAFGKAAEVLRRSATQDGPPFAAWFAADGDHTLRLDYPLGPDSVVMAVGGYKGNWSSDIFGCYACTVHIYEPVSEFVAALRQRFGRNPHIVIHPVGLSDRSGEARISVADDRSSVLLGSPAGRETISLVDVTEAIDGLGVENVNLMMMNIEGAEYDVIERMCASGAIRKIEHLQVQFHNFVPDAERRRRTAQDQLRATHELAWEYPFVWESWTRRKGGPPWRLG